VVFVGNRAYKVKKPVDLGFLDFTTREARQIACQREVELNRRMAPDVYLGVADVLGPEGEPCEHLVVMRRMPEDRRLSTCVTAGEDVGEALHHVARDVAALHESKPSDPTWDHVGRAANIRRLWDDGFATMDTFVGSVFDAPAVERARGLSQRYLAGRDSLFEARIEGGWIRDGHGDLRADDIFLLPDGPRVLDCLDFADELRWADALLDVAFLAMDLEHLGRPDLSRRFLAWHREFTADSWPPSLAHHYIAYRAQVRAKVTALRFGQGDEQAAISARELLDLACGHLERGAVRLVLVGGLPGTGKSTLANALADDRPYVVLRTDELRAGHPGGGSVYGSGRYTADAVRATYDTMLHAAASLLSMGESVILDASWRDANMRAAARDLARITSSDLVELRCDAPAELAAARIEARQAGDAVSEATVDVARAMASDFDPWPEAATIDTASTIETSRRDATDAVNRAAAQT
jgi:aminoglycoside phosphotransferase family enzyme/predicted kinase